MWIDKPVIDVITYFAQTSFYFMDFAVQLGTVIGILGICWCCVKIAFGTMEVQKALVSTITKFLLFIVILHFYPSLCLVVQKISTDIGMNASGDSKTTITTELQNFLEDLEEVVAQENDEIAAERAAALAARNELMSAGNLKETDGAIPYIINSWKRDQTGKRVADAEEMVKKRQENPNSNQRTAEAIKAVLKPIDEEGNISDTSTAEYYILDITLKDGAGQETGYLSPNAMLRIALLAAQILWEKEWTSVTDEWETKSKKLSLLDFPFYRVFDIMLVYICQIAIILSMIFSLLQYVACILEFTIVISVAVVCLPFILMDEFQDIAGKIIPAILGQAMKLAMITLCMFFAVWAFLSMAMNTIGEGTGFNLTTFTYIIFTIFLTFALTQFAPNLAVALLTGQPKLSTGEIVAAMGTAAVAGGVAYKAASMDANGAFMGANAAQKKAPAMAQKAVNRMGDMSAIGAAGSAASNLAKESGGNKAQQAMAGLGAMTGEAGYRTGQRFKSQLSDVAHRGAGAGGGGSSGGGVGVNRFEYNNDDYSKPGVGHMDYVKAQDDRGRALTAKEYIGEQASFARERALKNIKIPEAKTMPKNPNMAFNSQYMGKPPPAWDT